MQPEAYNQIRNDIYILLNKLEGKYTQAQIAKAINAHSSRWIFSAKDVNYLKDLRKKRWQGKTKSAKLIAFYDCLSKLIFTITENNTVSISPEEETEIINIITEGIKQEFELYKAIPDIDKPLKLFANYVAANGTAYNNVLQVAQRQIKRKWVINNTLNPSYHDIIDIRISKIEGNTAYVSTTEYWFLKWFDTINQEYAYQYENQNTQLYVLRKITDKWLVYTNIYSTGNVKKNPPPTHPSPSETRFSDIDQLTKHVHTKLLEADLSNALTPMVLFAEKLNNTEIHHRSLKLNVKVKEITRMHNLNYINWQEFIDAKAQLTQEIVDILDELKRCFVFMND